MDSGESSSSEEEAHRSEEEGVRYPPACTAPTVPDDYVPHFVNDERYLIDWSKGRCWTCARRGYLDHTCRDCGGLEKYTPYIGVCDNCFSLGSLASFCTGDYCDGHAPHSPWHAHVPEPWEQDPEEDTDADSGYTSFLRYLAWVNGTSEDSDDNSSLEEESDVGSDLEDQH